MRVSLRKIKQLNLRYLSELDIMLSVLLRRCRSLKRLDTQVYSRFDLVLELRNISIQLKRMEGESIIETPEGPFYEVEIDGENVCYGFENKESILRKVILRIIDEDSKNNLNSDVVRKASGIWRGIYMED